MKDKPPAPRPPTRARSTLGWWYTTTGKAREQQMLGTIIGIAAALLFPLFNSLLGLGWEAKAIPITLFIVLALGLNVVVGFAGLLDLGYAAFFAIGAYTVAFLTSAQSPIPWVARGQPGELLPRDVHRRRGRGGLRRAPRRARRCACAATTSRSSRSASARSCRS